MKKFKYIACALALVLAGCTKWLDVKPRGNMPEEGKFTSERGFQSALIGVYGMMADRGLYGRNATMHIPEFIAQNWVSEIASEAQTTTESDLNIFKYDDKARSSIDALFSNYYKAIAQVNVVIRNFEKTDVKFVGNHKAMMHGEALGLRALLHMELLRFFGPVPSKALPGSQALPYLFDTEHNPANLTSTTWQKYVDNIWVDLRASCAMLNGIDPIFTYNQTQMSTVPKENDGKGFSDDMAEQNRRSRFNYYAGVAAAARLHAWTGNMTAAADSAMVVINAKNGHGNLFNLSAMDSYNGAMQYRNFSMNTEHIFGVQNPRLMEIVGKDFTGVPNGTGAMPQKPVFGQRFDALDGINCLNSAANPIDVRALTSYWTDYEHADANSLYTYKKFIDIENGGPTGELLHTTGRVPVIRLAEMYFYVFEGRAVTDTEVNNMIHAYCAARSMGESLWETMTEGNKIEMLEREWRKDFYAEGQMFFFYKRHNYTNLTWPESVSVPQGDAVGLGGAWVLPKPLEQQAFDPYPKTE